MEYKQHIQKTSAMLIEEREAEMDCMTAIVGKKVSSTGRVLVAHNEDDPGRTVNNHAFVPGRDWPEGSVLPAEEGLAAIPQVSHTLGYYWSQVRGVNGGFTGADVFYNEKGVCVVSNNSSGSKELCTDETRLTDGGIGYNLRRIVAERAVSARNALEILIELVEKWGYAPSGRIYTVADANEAYMMQIVRGHHYIAARVPDDAIAVMPNHYTFHTLHDAPEMFYPADIISYAVEMGWYQPAKANDYSDFDFAKAYQAEDKYRTDGNLFRQKYGTGLLLNRTWNEEKEGMPFAVKAERTVTPENLMEFLSLHYEGTADDCRFGPGDAPHSTDVRRICTDTTIEATVFELNENPKLSTLWVAGGHPCQVPFLPMHPFCGIPDGWNRVEDPSKERDCHLEPRSEQVVYRDNDWQKLRDFEHLQEMCYAESIGTWKGIKAELQKDFRTENDAAVIAGDCAKLAGQSEQALRKAIEATQKLPLRTAQIEESAPISLSCPPSTYTVRFHCDGMPEEGSLLFGAGGLHMHDHFSHDLPGTLKRLDKDWYEASFDTSVFLDSTLGCGKYDFFLGGKTSDGHSFCGMTIIELTV